MAIQNIFVVGAGLMGSGIAQNTVTNGYTVTLIDQRQEAIGRANDKTVCLDTMETVVHNDGSRTRTCCGIGKKHCRRRSAESDYAEHWRARRRPIRPCGMPSSTPTAAPNTPAQPTGRPWKSMASARA